MKVVAEQEENLLSSLEDFLTLTVGYLCPTLAGIANSIKRESIFHSAVAGWPASRRSPVLILEVHPLQGCVSEPVSAVPVFIARILRLEASWCARLPESFTCLSLGRKGIGAGCLRWK